MKNKSSNSRTATKRRLGKRTQGILKRNAQKSMDVVLQSACRQGFRTRLRIAWGILTRKWR